MRLAGVVMQVDWQAALQGSQMMQQPKKFSRLAEQNVAQNMDRIRAEAASRGWLANNLPSGSFPLVAAASLADFKDAGGYWPRVWHHLSSCRHVTCLCVSSRGPAELSTSGALYGAALLQTSCTEMHMYHAGRACCFLLQGGTSASSWQGTAQVARWLRTMP